MVKNGLSRRGTQQWRCGVERRASAAARYERGREQRLAQFRDYYARNRNDQLAKSRAYYERNALPILMDRARRYHQKRQVELEEQLHGP